MAKSIIWAVMLTIVFIGAALAIRSVFKKNEAVAYDVNYVWHAETGPAGNVSSLVRGSRISEIRNDVNKLIIALNKYVEISESTRPQGDGVRTELPKIVLQKAEPRTTHIEVLNEQYLTQSMGSSGAQDYLAMVTYTLTETPGVMAIDFIFPGGDHAMPGIYSRESFTGYTIEDAAGKRAQKTAPATLPTPTPLSAPEKTE